MPAAVETMMYAGEVPWHGLGTYVGDEPIKSDEAIVAAGLDWEVEKRPLLFEQAPNANLIPQHVPGTGYPIRDLIEVPGQFAMVRSTDERPLGVVGSKYVPVQNREAFQFLDAVAGDDLRYHTAGSLKDGRLIWLLAGMGNVNIEPVDGDPVKPYLLFSNTHDGSSAVKAFLTTVRVVCNNTYAMALRTDGRSGISIRHSGNIKSKIEAAQEVLGLATTRFAAHSEELDHLASKQVDGTGWNRFLDNLVPLPPIDPETNEYATSPARTETTRNTLTELFEGGIGTDIPGVKGTAWAAMNAVTEYTTHLRATRGAGPDKDYQRAKRLESVWFGSSQIMAEKAHHLLMAA